MNSRLPRLTAREMQRILERRGFRVVRQRGSHRILRDDLGRRVTLPVHPRKILHPTVIAAIMEDAGIGGDDLV